MSNENILKVADSLNVKKKMKGVLEIVIKDKRGNVVKTISEENIIKIFSKEMLSHRLPSSQVWDPNADTGLGDWVDSEIDPEEEFSARYIILGASFDENGVPLDREDTRYYTKDVVTGTFVPVDLGVGAEFGGGLINAIPLAEPDRPLKRIESIDFEPSYQPSGTPFLEDDVRAINNILVLETTLKDIEYNGFGLSNSDFFTITEVALVGGKKFTTIGDCECVPSELFLEGSTDGDALLASIGLSGADVVTLDPSETQVDLIKEGDQIKIVAAGSSAAEDETLDQINPFYLVINKVPGGRDIQIDRVPVDSNNDPITGSVGLFRNTLRIFSHRILKAPVKKSEDFEILIRWRIIFN
jgi:hypothetical protein